MTVDMCIETFAGMQPTVISASVRYGMYGCAVSGSSQNIHH